MENTTSLNTDQSPCLQKEQNAGFFKMIAEDICCALKRDPAARNWFEVFINYAGLHAIWFYQSPWAVETQSVLSGTQPFAIF